MYKNSFEAAKKIIETDGILTFWSGIGPRSLRVIFFMASVIAYIILVNNLPTYDSPTTFVSVKYMKSQMQKKDIDLLYGDWDWSPDPNKYNFTNNKLDLNS